MSSPRKPEQSMNKSPVIFWPLCEHDRLDEAILAAQLHLLDLPSMRVTPRASAYFRR